MIYEYIEGHIYGLKTLNVLVEISDYFFSELGLNEFVEFSD